MNESNADTSVKRKRGRPRKKSHLPRVDALDSPAPAPETANSTPVFSQSVPAISSARSRGRPPRKHSVSNDINSEPTPKRRRLTSETDTKSNERDAAISVSAPCISLDIKAKRPRGRPRKGKNKAPPVLAPNADIKSKREPNPSTVKALRERVVPKSTASAGPSTKVAKPRGRPPKKRPVTNESKEQSALPQILFDESTADSSGQTSSISSDGGTPPPRGVVGAISHNLREMQRWIQSLYSTTDNVRGTVNNLRTSTGIE